MEGKTKLATVLEILEKVYVYFGRDDIELTDSATFSCPDIQGVFYQNK